MSILIVSAPFALAWRKAGMVFAWMAPWASPRSDITLTELKNAVFCKAFCSDHDQLLDAHISIGDWTSTENHETNGQENGETKYQSENNSQSQELDCETC